MTTSTGRTITTVTTTCGLQARHLFHHSLSGVGHPTPSSAPWWARPACGRAKGSDDQRQCEVGNAPEEKNCRSGCRVVLRTEVAGAWRERSRGAMWADTGGHFPFNTVALGGDPAPVPAAPAPAPARPWAPTNCAPTAAAGRSSALPPVPDLDVRNGDALGGNPHRHTAAPAADGAACADCGDT